MLDEKKYEKMLQEAQAAHEEAEQGVEAKRDTYLAAKSRLDELEAELSQARAAIRAYEDVNDPDGAEISLETFRAANETVRELAPLVGRQQKKVSSLSNEWAQASKSARSHARAALLNFRNEFDRDAKAAIAPLDEKFSALVK